jgi:hypothetical protein
VVQPFVTQVGAGDLGLAGHRMAHRESETFRSVFRFNVLSFNFIFKFLRPTTLLPRPPIIPRATTII